MRTLAAALSLLLPADASAAPVVVELFTSQGCSSCPPADALLSSWGREGFAAGRLIPLAFSVDYWNYLGWRDVFSAAPYTDRQREYSRTLKVGVYTPQMVVAGRAAFVGSDAARAAAEAERWSAQEPSAVITLSSAPSPRVRLAVTVEPLAAAGEPRLMLALFESGLETEVRSGENGGRRLRNDFVVRRLVDLGPLPKTKTTRHVDEAWDPAWRKENAGAAVFVQDARARAITAAAALYPLAPAIEPGQ